jgi:hypothetical protein
MPEECADWRCAATPTIHARLPIGDAAQAVHTAILPETDERQSKDLPLSNAAHHHHEMSSANAYLWDPTPLEVERPLIL